MGVALVALILIVALAYGAYRGQLLKDISNFKHRYLENSVLEMPETS
jgi:hypothetical protein